MQGAQAATQATQDKEIEPVPTDQREEEKVSYWTNKIFVALIGIVSTLLLTFGGWIIGSLNQINQSTSVLSTEFTAYKSDMNELKSAVDSLRIRGESWATKDSVTLTKDTILTELSKLKDQVSLMEIRVTRLEVEKPPR